MEAAAAKRQQRLDFAATQLEVAEGTNRLLASSLAPSAPQLPPGAFGLKSEDGGVRFDPV